MAKYHVTKKGEPGVCRATKGGCPLGGESDHYESKEEARKAFEEQQETQQLLEGLKRSPDFFKYEVVPEAELMPGQRAHRVGKLLVSTLPVPSITARGGVETLYETAVMDKEDMFEVIESTRDPDPKVHEANHEKALSFAIDYMQRIHETPDEKTARIMNSDEYKELLADANEVAEEDDPGSSNERRVEKDIADFAKSHGITPDDVWDMIGGSNWGKS